MSLKKYEAFVRTAELGSLTRAAEALGSTQSRISHILSDLEEEFGFSLMHRGRGGVRLTEAGAMVLPAMQAILKKDRELDDLIQDIRDADAGTVRLGAFTSVAVHWLPGMIRTFQAAHPKVDLQMYNGDYYDLEQWFLDGTIDLGFVTLPAPEGTIATPLAEDELVAVFISLPPSSAHDVHRALDKAGVFPKAKFTTKDDYAILAMVEQGLGVSIVPSLLLRGRRENLEVRPLEPRASRTIALATQGKETLPVVEAFARTAADWLDTHR